MNTLNVGVVVTKDRNAWGDEGEDAHCDGIGVHVLNSRNFILISLHAHTKAVP